LRGWRSVKDAATPLWRITTPGKRVGDERLHQGGQRQPRLDRITAGGQLLDLSPGEADVDEMLAALLAVAVALGSDGVGHADAITRRRLTEGYR
jgi:hypothetical protein